MDNQWAIFGGVLLAIVAVVYFVFIRARTDPRVKELAALAYKTAAEIAELPARGSTPPVRLKAARWNNSGVSVIGNYKWVGAFGKVLWDRILVIKDPARIWEVLVHEMTHAVRRRNGKPSSEPAAYATKALAAEMAPANLTALLEKL